MHTVCDNLMEHVKQIFRPAEKKGTLKCNFNMNQLFWVGKLHAEYCLLQQKQLFFFQRKSKPKLKP